jgi:UPF0755 protein
VNRFLKILISALLLLLVAIGVAWFQYQNFLAQPLDIKGSGNHLIVDKGASLRSVVRDLEQSGATRADWRWRILGRLEPVTIRAGEYALEHGLTPSSLLQLLSSGEVIHYRFTIIEGWTFKQLKQALLGDEVLIHEINTLDGVDAWQGRSEGLPLKSPDELLTLASIVEKESALDSERADIAGVFIRRLLQGWRLETDPSVIYGLGDDYDGDIRRRDLDTDTPYNTYTRFGLPPTPIAMAGKSALLAAANPADGNAMFFVASGDGGHVFSDTLTEHNAAVRKMLRRQP